MAEAARYMFDRSFDPPKRGSESDEAAAARRMQEEWERKLAKACRAAYEEGKAEGEAAALKRLEAEVLEQVKLLNAAAQKLLGNVERECDHVRRSAIELASTAANLLAGELISREPTLNVEALFREALEHIGDAPHVAVTVNDAHAQMVQRAVSCIAAENGFTGKIVVLGDPETRSGDCSLQWADGGIALDFEQTRGEIASLVRRHLDRLTGDGAHRANGTNGGAPRTASGPAPSPDNTEATADAPAETAGAGEPQ